MSIETGVQDSFVVKTLVFDRRWTFMSMILRQRGSLPWLPIRVQISGSTVLIAFKGGHFVLRATHRISAREEDWPNFLMTMGTVSALIRLTPICVFWMRGDVWGLLAHCASRRNDNKA
jgi:hypothetical protein